MNLICLILLNLRLDRNLFYLNANNVQGRAVAQLVEAGRFKPEGRGFDSRWCHWNFSLI
jgi:hypothetical protein